MSVFHNEEKHTPILYEKYKREHNLIEESQEEKHIKKSTRPWKVVGNLLATAILIGLIFLSIIGTITLTTPEMKSLLIEMVQVSIGV